MDDRYHRQRTLPEIGASGQARLAEARAAIVGCGALGCVTSEWLARAGVGELVLIDRDAVEASNLQRQTLYNESCVGIPKALAAAERLSRINSSLRIEPRIADLNPGTIAALLDRASILLDGTDNFEARYLLNDWSVKHGVPLVYAGVVGTGGLVMPIVTGSTPCLRCLFDEPPTPGSQPTCQTAGVLGPAVGIVASTQAARAIRILVEGTHPPMLTEINAWSGRTRDLDPGLPRAGCPCCARRSFEFLDGARAGLTASLCGSGAIQVSPSATTRSIDPRELARRLSAFGVFQATAHLARGTINDESGAVEITVFGDARAIIRGVKDESAARSIYSKYVGN